MARFIWFSLLVAPNLQGCVAMSAEMRVKLLELNTDLDNHVERSWEASILAYLELAVMSRPSSLSSVDVVPMFLRLIGQTSEGSITSIDDITHACSTVFHYLIGYDINY